MWKKKINNNIIFRNINRGSIYPFFYDLSGESILSEGIIGSLIFFIVANIIIGLLLLSVNSSFSLSMKYYDKGGGFECGFTSFIQTRERYNIIFYRVSLLFLVFDLEIILVFPFTAIYKKNQNTNKNNVLIFLYILFVGFIYELKEGALNIVKTTRSTEVNIDGLYKYLDSTYNNSEILIKNK
jgi:NADH:ubiquinone oxidoreductase subunit 3 (subunit A)